MKIVHIVTRSDTIGGVQVHIREICHRLLTSGHEVLVLAGGKGPFISMMNKDNIPCSPLRYMIRPIHPVVDCQALFNIRSILCRLQPDLVCTHSSKAGLLGRIAARSLGIPVIFTIHGWAFSEGVAERNRRLYLPIERFAARFADRMIAVSEYDRRLALNYNVGSSEQIITIHVGVPDIPNMLWANAEAEPARMVMVARFDQQKDHATLFKALQQIKDSKWELDLIGDGPLRSEVQVMLAKCGIEERVRLHGECADVADRLQEALGSSDSVSI